MTLITTTTFIFIIIIITTISIAFVLFKISQPYHLQIPDIYFQRMNDTDLRVRNCATKQECKKRYHNALCSMSRAQKRILKQEIELVDRTVAKLFPKLVSIPWKLQLFSAISGMENGYPHTHGDEILLPDNMIRAGIAPTLLHEKIHVYQRLYPLETHRFIVDFMGFSLAIPRYKKKEMQLRSNPDINQILYSYSESGQLLLPEYKPNASTLVDIIDRNDHPYEVMAYSIQEFFFPTGKEQKYGKAIESWLV